MTRRDATEAIGGVCVVVAAGMFDVALGVLTAGVLMIVVANLGADEGSTDASAD